MDRVFIKGLSTLTQIGVYEWEKTLQQQVIFDVEMGWDTSPCAEKDEVALALNYAEVSASILDFCKTHHFALIETLANQVADMLIHQFSIPYLKLTLQKPHAIQAAKSVGVIIERGKK